MARQQTAKQRAASMRNLKKARAAKRRHQRRIRRRLRLYVGPRKR